MDLTTIIVIAIVAAIAGIGVWELTARRRVDPHHIDHDRVRQAIAEAASRHHIPPTPDNMSR